MKEIQIPKTLALLSPGDDIQELLLSPENIDICYIYKNEMKFFSRCIKRLKLLFPFNSLAFSNEFRHIDLAKYDVIILDETIYPDKVIKYVRKCNQTCKIIYWMWNTVEYSGRLRLYNKWKRWHILLSMREKYNFEISSFDKEDCNRYNLTYNNQVAPFFRDLSNPNPISNSIFFFGKDKGRLSHLRNLADEFRSLGYVCDFNVVPDARKKYSAHDFDGVKRAHYTAYRDLIKSELSSSLLLEILQDGQGGITWRALEAMFYKRKLITNFQNIRKYDFYNESNIYIIGLDDKEKIKQFMKTPYQEIPETIKNRYTFKGWLQNMVNN